MAREIRAAAETNLGTTLKAKVYYDSGTAMVQREPLTVIDMTEQPALSGLYSGLKAVGQLPTDEIILEISGVPSGGGTFVPAANIEAISNDEDAAVNLEDQFDGTGYVHDTAPSTQAQVGNLTSGSAAINTTAESFTPSGAEPETPAVDGHLKTKAADSDYHIVEDIVATGITDCYYQFDVGGNGVPVSVTWEGYAQGQGDSYAVSAKNWGTGLFEQIGTIVAANGTTHVIETFALTNAHVGTGSDIGKVQFKFYSTDGTAFATDRILCAYAVVAQSVGYADGAVWVDTVNGTAGTENYVNGTADNPVKTWADALTLAGSMGLSRFQIVNGSTIELTGDSSHYSIFGVEYSLLLAGQSIQGMYVIGALVTGIGTGTAYRFEDCKIGSVTLGPGGFKHCGIGVGGAAFTAGTIGQFIFSNCFSLVPGSGSPSFNFDGLGGTVGINNRGWKGGAEYTLDSDCTLSHEVLAGGGTTITTGGADVEVRGITRSVTLNVAGVGGICQFVGTTGPIIIDGANATCDVNLYGVSASLDESSTTANVSDETVNPVDIAVIAADVENIDGDAMRGTDNANEVVPDIAGTAAGLHSTTDGLINALENASPEEFVESLKLSDGWLTDTSSGTLSFKQIIAILTAWAAGKVEDDGSGDYNILDPEDDNTVIYKLTTVSETSPYKDTDIS